VVREAVEDVAHASDGTRVRLSLVLPGAVDGAGDVGSGAHSEV